MIHWTDCVVIMLAVFYVGMCVGGILEIRDYETGRKRRFSSGDREKNKAICE